MTRKKGQRQEYDRLTVPLANGQREALDRIAKRNNASLAFVVRYALGEFLRRHNDDRLTLDFPTET
jgi:predicted transcriptional regulator